MVTVESKVIITSLDERIRTAERQRAKAKNTLKNNRWKLKYLRAEKKLKMDTATTDFFNSFNNRFHVNSYKEFINKYDVVPKGSKGQSPF